MGGGEIVSATLEARNTHHALVKGEGADKRREVCEKMVGAWMKLLKGKEHNSEFEAGFREMFKDIVRYLENKKLAIFSMWMFKGKGQSWGRRRLQGFFSRPT